MASGNTEQEAGVGEVYCIDCGEVIKEQAEICPECGVRQPQAQSQSQGGQPAPQQAQGRNARGQQAAGQNGTAQQESYGILYAHVDANRRKHIIRNLLDLCLVFVSVGIYLGVMIGEGLRHYYRLNRGSVQPYDPEVHDSAWIV